MKKKNKSAVIYCRVASINSKKNNLQQQIETCKQYASQNDYHVMKIFQEQANGRVWKRDGLKQLLSFLKRKTPEDTAVITVSPDRLSRNMVQLRKVMALIKKLKAQIIFVNAFPKPSPDLTAYGQNLTLIAKTH